jgi:hypothetical protein
MEAALARIEANLNNRPLTEVPVSSMEETPLTPYILMTGYPNFPAMDDTTNLELTNPPNIMDLKPANRIKALVQAFRHRFILEYAPIITRRPVDTALAKYGVKMNDYVIYMDPTLNPARWKRGIISKVYPGKDYAVRVADIKLKNGTIVEKRPTSLMAKIDIRLEDPEAESERYKKYCELLVKKISNVSKGPTSSEQGENQPQEGNSLCHSVNLVRAKMSKAENSAKILTKIYKNGKNIVDRASNIMMTTEQLKEYVDYSGKSIVYATNFPPTFAAADVFAVMSEFGEVKLIASSTWNGTRPFNCFVGFADSASVSTAIMWSESQIICANNIAYCQKFEKLKKRFSASREIKKPIFALLDMQISSQAQRVLFITPSESDARGMHKKMPVSSETGAFINVCSRKKKYDFVTTPIDMSKADADIQNLPTVPKPEVVEPCVHDDREGKRAIAIHNGNIIVTVNAESKFESHREYAAARQPDLREIINKRKELSKIRNRICRPRSR